MTGDAGDPKELVARSYDRIAEAHAAWAATVRTDERARYVSRLIARIPAGARLFELGCWLRPNGLFVAGLGLSDNPAGYGADWLGAPMVWSGYERHVSERLVAAAGLAIESATIETADEDGDRVSFLWAEARRL